MAAETTGLIAAVSSGNLGNILNFLAATAALGTAAMGLVDTLKVFGGGPSRFGFGYVKSGLEPFLAPLGDDSPAFGKTQVLQTLKANWLNGVAKADQKAKAKSLIHLGLTKDSAKALADAAGVDADNLERLAHKIAKGAKALPDEINVLGQFDAVLSAVLDSAYERGDQKYRNASKFCAMLMSIVLATVGGLIVFGPVSFSYLTTDTFWFCALTGAIATPLAPVAKDLASSLQAAVTAVSTLKR